MLKLVARVEAAACLLPVFGARSGPLLKHVIRWTWIRKPRQTVKLYYLGCRNMLGSRYKYSLPEVILKGSYKLILDFYLYSVKV